eukprot:s4397_g4.t1
MRSAKQTGVGWELGTVVQLDLTITSKEAPGLLEGSTVQPTVAELLATLVAMEVFGYFKKGALPVKVDLYLRCFFHGLVLKLDWRPRESKGDQPGSE